MICIRASLLRTATGVLLLWVGCVCAAPFLLSSALSAQGGTSPTPAPTPAPAGQTPPASGTLPAAPAATAGDKALASVLSERLQLRCFASDLSPSYEDTLPRGAVVGVGRLEGGFRQVLLPIGPVGYVSKRFTSPPADGLVKTIGRGVSFRYRPKTGEAPTTNLPEATELHVVGEHEDWWKVRAPMAETWAPQVEVQVFDAPGETMRLAHAELEKVHRGEVQEHLRKLAEAAELARRHVENRDKIAEFSRRLREEGDKPVLSQTYAPLEQELAAFASELPEDSALHADVKTLQQRIADRKWVVEATAVRNAEPVPPKDLPDLVPLVRDRLDRFDATGWLRYHAVLGRPGYYTLEKGKQVLYHITCTNMRYDLALFIDKEVGLVGPRRRPAVESLRVLDVEKIEVLGIPVAR